MFSSVGIVFLFLVYCKAQLRPNWDMDMDVLRFDQNDWNRYDKDFGQNGKRPFPSFRPNRIPTQQPPIVGQIPGQIGGQGGQKGQSGNDNIPPPLPPMPRQPIPPNPLPIPSQSPPLDLGGGLNPTTMHPLGDKPTPTSGNPPTPPLMPSEEPPLPGAGSFGPQDQLPPPMEPFPTVGEAGTVTNVTEVPNQSETPPSSNGEGEVTSTQVPTGGDSGFSFGYDMDTGFGQEGSTVSQEKFGFSGEDMFSTTQPSEGGVGIDQRSGAVGGDLMGEISEPKKVFMSAPRGRFGDNSAKPIERTGKGVLDPGLNGGVSQIGVVSPVKLQGIGGSSIPKLNPKSKT